MTDYLKEACDAFDRYSEAMKNRSAPSLAMALLNKKLDAEIELFNNQPEKAAEYFEYIGKSEIAEFGQELAEGFHEINDKAAEFKKQVKNDCRN